MDCYNYYLFQIILPYFIILKEILILPIKIAKYLVTLRANLLAFYVFTFAYLRYKYKTCYEILA